MDRDAPHQTTLSTSEVEQAKCDRAAGLDDMVAASEDAGLYDLPPGVPFERLDSSATGLPVVRLGREIRPEDVAEAEDA